MDHSRADHSEPRSASFSATRAPARRSYPVVRARDVVHGALLYGSLDELISETAAFLESGVDSGDAIVLSAAPEVAASVLSVLPADEAAAVLPVDLTGAGTSAQALRRVIEALCEASSGDRPVRLVCHHDLKVLPRAQFDELCRADAAFNVVCPVPYARVLCCFDATELSEDTRDVVAATHPLLVEDGVAAPSIHYRGPSVFLEAALREPLSPPSGPVAELSAPFEVMQARVFVRSKVEACGLSGQRLADFVSATNEVVTNALRYAGMDSVRVWCEEGRVVCEVRDRGAGLIDPLVGYRIPTIGEESGWGMWLARQLVDLVEVRSVDPGCVVRLHAGVS